jgi:hypothetical protein
MTTERSGQHLMQLTLGDSTLIRSTDDAERLLARLDEQYRQDYKKQSADAIERVRSQADAEIKHAQTEAERNAELARSADAQALLVQASIAAERELTSKQLAERAAEVGRIQDQLQGERNRRLVEKIPIIIEAMEAAKKRHSRARLRQGVIVFFCITAATIVGTSFFTDWNRWLGLVSAVSVGVLTVLFSSFLFDPRFSKRAMQVRDASFEQSAKKLNFSSELSAYCIDWDSGSVTLAETPRTMAERAKNSA